MLITTSNAHSPYFVVFWSSPLDPSYTKLRIDSVVIWYSDGATEQVASSSTGWMSYAEQPEHKPDRRFGRQYDVTRPIYYVFPRKLSLSPKKHSGCEVVVNGVISNADGVQFQFTTQQKFDRYRAHHMAPYWYALGRAG
ncbi:MAG: hypothetical protein IH899_20590 [Planctomycetes bacterium]|nr:hypothetical protein [Planctomycetota bacterium]